MVDPASGHLYLTEDESDGRFYRFVPDDAGDLSSGQLAVARVTADLVDWLAVPDPSATTTPTRYQVPGSESFDGGEGMTFFEEKVFFATKGDNRVWAYDLDSSRLSITYDRSTASNPILSGVDNLEVSTFGDLLVAEDGGNMEIVAITAAGQVLPLLRVISQGGSEITGPAFTPAMDRLYFSSQRGTSGSSSGGITYEISGPFIIEP